MGERVPTEAEVKAAIEIVKAHLDAGWISCCMDDHAFGCASCQAVLLKKQLDGLASWLDVSAPLPSEKEEAKP